MPVKHICVFGIGGIGGVIGSRIITGFRSAGKPTNNIYFIARGSHRDEIRKNGLILESEKETHIAKPGLVSSEVEDIPQLDLCILGVKSYDLETACRQLKSKIKQDTVIIPILNGVDIYERMREIITTGFILPGCVYMNAFVKKPGVITHRSGDVLAYGKDPRHNEFYPVHVREFFGGVPLSVRWHEDPYPVLWKKYLFVASYALVTAYSGQTIKNVYNNEALRALLVEILEEINAISSKKGYAFPPDVIEKICLDGGRLPIEATTSYQRDLIDHPARNEGDIFGGAIIRMGEELGVPTPTTEKLYAGIRLKYNV
ncbi:MAG: ketopantoate reductase family protein [Bacteroidota bacterium]